MRGLSGLSLRAPCWGLRQDSGFSSGCCSVIEQVIIGVTGVLAIWLSQDHRQTVRRWASVVGCIGQPFWFIAMWKAEQYGILVLCCFYTVSWIRGLYNNWIRKP